MKHLLFIASSISDIAQQNIQHLQGSSIQERYTTSHVNESQSN